MRRYPLDLERTAPGVGVLPQATKGRSATYNINNVHRNLLL